MKFRMAFFFDLESRCVAIIRFNPDLNGKLIEKNIAKKALFVFFRQNVVFLTKNMYFCTCYDKEKDFHANDFVGQYADIGSCCAEDTGG